MIILITGQPGAGKTALCVDLLANDPEFKRTKYEDPELGEVELEREIYVSGIPELKIEHKPTPPVADWCEMRPSPEDPSIHLAYFKFPPGALVVLDEAQRIYRPRPASSRVPAEVAAFETHRHTGVDFVLLTQHPGLLDSNIRKLVGRHIHIAVTPFGRYTYEWTKCVDPESKAEREIAARNKYKPPVRSFDLYKSSELHTKIKVKMPLYYYLAAAALVLLLGLVWYGYNRISGKATTTADPVAVLPSGSQAADLEAPPSSERPQTAQEYLASIVPRVPGLYHTAPRYDDITKPTDAPWPAACILNHQANKCRCVDQQGNHYAAPDHLCRNIVKNGIFKDWTIQQAANSGANAEPVAAAPGLKPGLM